MPQVQREAAKVNERHGWSKPGDAWGYRRHAYRSGLLAFEICTTQSVVLNCEGARTARGGDLMSDVMGEDISLVLLMQDNG